MKDEAITVRAIAACYHRCQRMAYLQGGSDRQRDTYTANLILLSYWKDKARKLNADEEAEIDRAAQDLIKRTMLENPTWHQYHKTHTEQILAFSAQNGGRLDVTMATIASMTWRELAENQILRIQQDYYAREKIIAQMLDEGSQDPLVLFHAVEHVEVREITGLVTEKDIGNCDYYSNYLPDWRNRLEAVYFSGYDPKVILKQFTFLFCYTHLLMPHDANDGAVPEASE